MVTSIRPPGFEFNETSIKFTIDDSASRPIPNVPCPKSKKKIERFRKEDHHEEKVREQEGEGRRSQYSGVGHVCLNLNFGKISDRFTRDFTK